MLGTPPSLKFKLNPNKTNVRLLLFTIVVRYTWVIYRYFLCLASRPYYLQID